LSTMKSLLTIAVCNLFQSLNSLMSWYASNYPGFPKCSFKHAILQGYLQIS
jgi:hypothetical protein